MLAEGFLYIATGETYIKEALQSLRTLKQYHPTAHSTLITDQAVELTDFNQIKIIDFPKAEQSDWKKGILYKIIGLQHSPYQKTVFLDTDTFVLGDCSTLFNLANYHELMVCYDAAYNPPVTVDGSALENYDAYNTGVIVFQKTESVNQLFNKWLSTYKQKYKAYPHDQPPFMEALLYTKVKLYVLPNIYNFRNGFYTTLRGAVKILHARDTDYQKIAKRVNEKIGARIWLPKEQNLYNNRLNKLYRGSPTIVKNFYRNFKKIWTNGEV